MSIPQARVSGRTRRVLLAGALPAALAAAALPAAANAASVSEGRLSNGQIQVAVLDRSFFIGGSVENNNVSVAIEGDFLVIRDTAGITTEHQVGGGRCVRVTTLEARCPRSVDDVALNLAAGDDQVEYRAPVKGFVSLGHGSDTVFGGRREASGRIIEPVTYSGGPGLDVVSYVRADRGVTADLDQIGSPITFNDGRAGDREGISVDVEVINGSNFNDTLIGSDRNEVFRGLNGDDMVAALGGDDFIEEGSAPNGADQLGGGPGTGDRISYVGRTAGVSVSLDSVRNDGATGEQDNVGGSTEHIFGTNFRDVLTGNGQANALDGFGGNDTIDGLGGNDTLSAGAGNNGISGGTGNDVIEARNGEIDNVDCGENSNDSDTANRDTNENRVVGCERGTVGVLRLAPATVRAEAGESTRLTLSWRHPRAWKRLRSIELRLTREHLPVGEITIDPLRQRISANGALSLARRTARLVRDGKTIVARLSLRLDESLAGETLQAEVEATDRRGRRQLERNAGTIRVGS